MANEIEIFWNALPPNLKGFIVSTAAGWASSLASRHGTRGKSDVHQALQDAYQEGLKNFIPHFGENCRYAMQDLLADEEAKSFLNDIIRDESLASDPRRLEDAISRAGLDTGTIDGFDIHQAIDSFLQGFLAKAELSKELIPWLSLDELRKIRKTLKPVTPDLDNLKEKYFTYLWEQHSHMSFKGLTEGKLLSIPLKHLYVRPRITEELPADSREYLRSREYMDRMELTRHMERVKEVDLSDIVESEYSVITGDPGSGKSTLLKYIALAYVDQEQKERLGTEEDLLPILFPIAAYAERFKGVGSPAGYCLREFIPEYFKGENLPDLDPLFQDAAGNGRALFLIDGLDEVSDETERKKMVRHVRNFIIDNEYAGNRYCVTCRTASYTKATRFEPVSGTDFSEYCVQPFDEDQVSHFLLSWYRWYEREIKHRQQHIETRANESRDRMMAAITGDPNILSIARNPLMLTILALIEHEGGELPQNRADLYEKCLKMLAGSWQKIRSIHETEGHGFMLGDMRIDDVFVIEYLGPIATEMHKNAAPAIEYTDLRTRLTEEFDEIHRNKQLSRQNAENFIRIMREGSGILQEVSPGTYGFMHQTFKEYLTARVLTDLRDEPVSELGEGLFEPEWKEVVFLSAASLKKNQASNFVNNIMEKETEHFRNLILAGKCVKDIGRNRVFPRVYDELVGRMLDVINGDFEAADRASVGEILGWLGDPRALEVFIPITGGEYRLSKGTQCINDFEICKYPVTNQWFRRFVKQGGYAERSYWTKEGVKWLDYTSAKHPDLWNDRKWNCPNSPVVGVSWWEADAFCRWLTLLRNDGYVYRLPDEWEWEAAAAGRDGRECPWGDWGHDRCNSEESGTGKTSPVGIFAKEDTPEGVSDMRGNVWEWTRSDYHSRIKLDDFRFDQEVQNLYDKELFDKIFEKLKEKTRQLPVLRGGSWGYTYDFARCADRYSSFPLDRDFNVGFRCLRT